MEVTEVQKITQNVIAEASKVVIAGEAVVEKLLVALLAGGHVLLEDRPGSGKTTLAKTFARLLDVEQKRVYTCDVGACPCVTMLCGNAGKNICDTR